MVSVTGAEIDELVEFSSRVIAHVERSIMELRPKADVALCPL